MNKKLVLFIFFIFIKQYFFCFIIDNRLRMIELINQLDPLQNGDNYTFMRFADKKILKKILDNIITFIKNKKNIVLNHNNIQYKNNINMNIDNLNKDIDTYLQQNTNFIFGKNDLSVINFLNIIRLTLYLDLQDDDYKEIADDLQKLILTPFQQDIAIIKNHVKNNLKKYLIGSGLLFSSGYAYFNDYENLISLQNKYKSIFFSMPGSCSDCNKYLNKYVLKEKFLLNFLKFPGIVIQDLMKKIFQKNQPSIFSIIGASGTIPINLSLSYIIRKLKNPSINLFNFLIHNSPIIPFIAVPVGVIGFPIYAFLKNPIKNYFFNPLKNYFIGQ